MTWKLDYRNSVLKAYRDVYTPAALEALEVLVPFNRDRRELMARRIARRLARQNGRQRIAFLDPQVLIPRTHIRVQDAREVRVCSKMLMFLMMSGKRTALSIGHSRKNLTHDASRPA
jgi:hypothetical protein